jgi:hypothetical protein
MPFRLGSQKDSEMELKTQIRAFHENSKEMSKTEAESRKTEPMINGRTLLVIKRAHGRVLYPLVVTKRPGQASKLSYAVCQHHFH